MVAYSFKKQFAEPILAGTKRQTIRADRRRHARAGEALQLYTGMRTKQCRLIANATCTEALPIRLDFAKARVELPGARKPASPVSLQALAKGAYPKPVPRVRIPASPPAFQVNTGFCGVQFDGLASGAKTYFALSHGKHTQAHRIKPNTKPT